MPAAGRYSEHQAERGPGGGGGGRRHQADGRGHLLPDELLHRRVEALQEVQRARKDLASVSF